MLSNSESVDYDKGQANKTCDETDDEDVIVKFMPSCEPRITIITWCAVMLTIRIAHGVWLINQRGPSEDPFWKYMYLLSWPFLLYDVVCFAVALAGALQYDSHYLKLFSGMLYGYVATQVIYVIIWFVMTLVHPNDESQGGIWGKIGELAIVSFVIISKIILSYYIQYVLKDYVKRMPVPNTQFFYSGEGEINADPEMQLGVWEVSKDYFDEQGSPKHVTL